MRTSTESVCGGVSGGRGARRAPAPRVASVQASATSRLSFPALPSIADEVPCVIERPRNRQAVAELAQFLIDSGIITSRRFCSASAGLHAPCQHALNSWLAAAIGDVKCFSPYFELRMARALPDGRADGMRIMDPMDDLPPRSIEVRWKESSVCHWGIGAGLDYLEQCVPMLGSTALDIMECKGGHAYPLFTPGMALDEASYLYWRGEDDETLVLDEDCGDDQAARDAMAQDMITRADIQAAFPAWALDYNRPRLAESDLARIAAEHSCPYVRRAATLATALDRARTTAQYCTEEEDGTFIGFGAVLCWREGDLTVQISDDYANLAWQSEYCDDIGKVVISLDDPAAMRRWMRKVRPNLSAIGLLDGLLLHLIERE